VEPHTIHGRLRDFEENFIYEMCKAADVVLFKSHYQKWRLDWTFSQKGWKTPKNIMIVPHGARPDRYWSPEEIPKLKKSWD
jgi:1,2-diacylglycerol 3-alpha-glucosyltransferase